jgi:hypothetical protein
MLRLETETGWQLVTHPDHARLAGAFAERWGNDQFLRPRTPRSRPERDRLPRRRLSHPRRCPANHAPGNTERFLDGTAGKYSAFEEIDLADYLAVRSRAVRLIAAEDPEG